MSSSSTLRGPAEASCFLACGHVLSNSQRRSTSLTHRCLFLGNNAQCLQSLGKRVLGVFPALLLGLHLAPVQLYVVNAVWGQGRRTETLRERTRWVRGAAGWRFREEGVVVAQAPVVVRPHACPACLLTWLAVVWAPWLGWPCWVRFWCSQSPCPPCTSHALMCNGAPSPQSVQPGVQKPSPRKPRCRGALASYHALLTRRG